MCYFAAVKLTVFVSNFYLECVVEFIWQLIFVLCYYSTSVWCRRFLAVWILGSDCVLIL
jgi:hypothetical protein